MSKSVVVSKANIVETAEWCNGLVRAGDAGVPTGLYIQVNSGVTKWNSLFRAYIGDTIELIDNRWKVIKKSSSSSLG